MLYRLRKPIVPLKYSYYIAITYAEQWAALSLLYTDITLLLYTLCNGWVGHIWDIYIFLTVQNNIIHRWIYIVLLLRKICSTILSRDNSGYVVTQLNDPKSDLIGCPVYQAVIFVYPTIIPYHYGDNTAYWILS